MQFLGYVIVPRCDLRMELDPGARVTDSGIAEFDISVRAETTDGGPLTLLPAHLGA